MMRLQYIISHCHISRFLPSSLPFSLINIQPQQKNDIFNYYLKNKEKEMARLWRKQVHMIMTWKKNEL